MKRVALGVVTAAVLVGGIASAQTADALAQSDAVTQRRWAFGIQVEPLNLPSGHIGIPLQGTEDGAHLGAAFSLRYQMGDWWAVYGAVGTPTSALGPAVWAGQEVFHRLWASSHEWVAVSVYEDAAIELGFAGPDYYARRDGTFVGYDYAYSGPLSLAIRLPIGVRADWLRNRFDTYVEGGAVLTAIPSAETLFDLAVGARFHF